MRSQMHSALSLFLLFSLFCGQLASANTPSDHFEHTKITQFVLNNRKLALKASRKNNFLIVVIVSGMIQGFVRFASMGEDEKIDFRFGGEVATTV